MEETKRPEKETAMSTNSQDASESVQPNALASALTLTEDEQGKVKTIKNVYGALGQILDENRKAKSQREKDDIARVIWPIRFIYLSWIFWLLLFAIYPQAVDSLIAQLLLIVNGLVALGIYFAKAFNLRRLKKKTAKERMEVDGEKAALELISENKMLLDVADESILKEVELKQKSELSLVEARFVAVTNFLKNMIPGAIALAVLFGFTNSLADTPPKPSPNTLPDALIVGRILAFLGAIVTLILISIEALAQRYIIEKKECIAMLEQAQMKQTGDTPPLKNTSGETTAKEKE